MRVMVALTAGLGLMAAGCQTTGDGPSFGSARVQEQEESAADALAQAVVAASREAGDASTRAQAARNRAAAAEAEALRLRADADRATEDERQAQSVLRAAQAAAQEAGANFIAPGAPTNTVAAQFAVGDPRPRKNPLWSRAVAASAFTAPTPLPAPESVSVSQPRTAFATPETAGLAGARPTTTSPASRSPSIAASSVSGTASAGSSAAFAGLLAVHNDAREEVGVAPLAWSGDAAAGAQAWADRLAEDNACLTPRHSVRPANNPTQYGESIYARGARVTALGDRGLSPVNGRDVAEAFYAEKASYDPVTNACVELRRAGAVRSECGHYTQMVWSGSTAIGCGRAVCADQSQVWVCRYTPSGNVVGERPYPAS